MKRVLFTGAMGFIGRHCLSPLSSRGYEVHAVSSRPIAMNTPGICWHQADLLNPAQSEPLLAEVRPTHLLHLAWYAELGKYWTSEKNLSWVQASLNLLQVFAQQGGQRVVMAGTCAEYDWRYGYCSEALTPLAPATLYGATKHALQLMLTAFAKQTGLSAAWGRVFFLFGPHEHPDRLVASIVRSILKGEPARATHGNQIRDFLYVEDVAGAFVALLDSEVAGPVNIASGRPVALRDVIDVIAAARRRPDLVQLGALPTRPGEPDFLAADVRRLREEVGWRPSYTLEVGLEKTVAWWAQVITDATRE